MTKDLNVEEDSVIHRMLQAVAVPVIGNVCHIFMHGLNSVQVCFFFFNTNSLHLIVPLHFEIHCN